MQAGTPTPSYAAPATSRPGDPRHALPDAGHPVDVADGVLRQGAAPPLDALSTGAGRRAPRASDEVGERDGDQLAVGALEVGLLALPADRGAQQEQVGGLGLHPRPTCRR